MPKFTKLELFVLQQCVNAAVAAGGELDWVESLEENGADPVPILTAIESARDKLDEMMRRRGPLSLPAPKGE